jgi:hypothetical protein
MVPNLTGKDHWEEEVQIYANDVDIQQEGTSRLGDLKGENTTLFNRQWNTSSLSCRWYRLM